MLEPQPPLLLFVCIENSSRSQMAEGFAKALGEDRIQSFSAGSKPSGQVDPRAVRFMTERGVSLEGQAPKGLDDLPKDVTWDYLVTMGCGEVCPHLPARHRLDWDLADPKKLSDDDYRRARDEIERRVHGLIEEASSR